MHHCAAAPGRAASSLATALKARGASRPARPGWRLHMPIPEPTPPGKPHPPPRPEDIEPIQDPEEDETRPPLPVRDPPRAPNSDVPERLNRAGAGGVANGS